MNRCLSCTSEIPDASRFCPACGKPVAGNSETAVMPPVSTPRSGLGYSRAAGVAAKVASTEGGFGAGMVFAARYQIIGLLGKGGMGEVYRANDLTLDQPVALKFLPAAMAQDAAMLSRFHNEVRLARQVSHPNVCRVYDLGEVDGRPYLSMEYIDGEDLGSLLRRIGRLSADKALEFARRICAGLAAAHDRGVLHRDLKPSNIMIDGRGSVFITDFGLAAVIGDLRETQAREGTPAYMAPEQLAGREVTARSDIYALGLVLYEMFAGKRPFVAGTLAEMIRLQQSSSPSLTTVVKDIDPAVDRVIQRCLSPDPGKRPPNALAVAAALPGGDPLAAALAAGETPSPDLVAASGQTAGMRQGRALACLAATIAGLIAVTVWLPRAHLATLITLEHSPEVLAEKSRDLIRSLGYTGQPGGRAQGFEYDLDYIQYVQQHDRSANRWEHRLGDARPSLIQFWYRQSPRPLAPDAFSGTVSDSDPPQTVSGMARVWLDPQGRLLEFTAVPPQIDKSAAAVPPPDWKRLFDAAGLDIARFTPAAPEWTPLSICDVRAAWTGALGQSSAEPVRIETAAWRGKPVYFQIIGSWTRATRMQSFQIDTRDEAFVLVALAMVLSLVVGAAILARHNIRRGRGDRRGAARLAIVSACFIMLNWAFGASHVAEFDEAELLIAAVSASLLVASIVWVLYMAVEPVARRRWPHSLIAWNRLLAGNLHDPLVGSDLLVGVTLGIGAELLMTFRQLVVQHFGEIPPVGSLEPLMGVPGTLAAFCSAVPMSVALGLGWFALIFVFRIILRRDWMAAATVGLLLVVLNGLHGTAAIVPAVAFSAAGAALLLLVMLRFGLVSLIAYSFVEIILSLFPITADFSAWYAGASLFALLAIGAVAAFAFHASLGGHSLLGDQDA